MFEIYFVLLLAWFAGIRYAVVLQKRAEPFRSVPYDRASDSRGEITPEGQRLLARARLWFLVCLYAPFVLAGIICVIYVVEASRGRESWGLPVGGVVTLAGGLLFRGTGRTAPVQRPWRGYPDALGFALRRMRNRVAVALLAVGLLIMVISAG